ncbi:MAG: histidinol dehydrogenase [Eubacteriales bacterium]|nr:histidinol dehydrogenase [Eubacteriales bacterium]MDD3880657.1 histidinol dehydrogenase [Eubacteriales bacterium]MDD4513562.1 histidinol dehydrogenase [Eubacteriales bacterium]
MLPIFSISDRVKVEERLLKRSQLDDENVTESVKDIIKNVRERGDAALCEYTEKFDGVRFSEARDMLVTREEIDAAYAAADPEWLEDMRKAKANIIAFHEKQKRETWVDFKPGSALGQMIRPLSRVGLYVPGGTAAYPSSVMMEALPALVAGVEDIVMVTPPGKDGGVSFPLSIVAADMAGVTRIYKVGGAQAVAALAFGTETIPRVDKITGPGNIYVATAKREVFGYTGIDMFAGPSEVLVIADESANPAYVAADLLSQAEHDRLSAVMLITDSQDIAEKTAAEVEKQLAALPRVEIARKSLENYGAIVVTNNLLEAAELASDIAPEHLELCVKEPFNLLGYIRNAGAIFLGHMSPEPLGDYFAGPNHVLPTSGTARFFSPLSVDDFVKRTSLIYYSREKLMESADSIINLARSEGLDAHANAVLIRKKDAE